MADLTVLTLKKYDATDPRLGRHIAHDARSLRFRVAAKEPRLLRSNRHQVMIPLLDQLNEGSCTGHGFTAAIASAAHWEHAKKFIPTDAEGAHQFARQVYMDATKLDPWPGEFEPDDTGSDGLSVAKVGKARGLISGYQHATSLNAALTALEAGVVIVGTAWMTDMFEPARDGQVSIGGVEEGGHEYALDEIDVANQRVWIRNSWGPSWGLQGRAWLSWSDLGKLLANYGDCTSFVPITAPPPVPTPVEPSKPKLSPEEAALWRALDKNNDNRNAPAYLKIAAANWQRSKS